MRVADLFCGCGGMSAGLAKAGFEIALAIDHWRLALEVYERNLGHTSAWADLSDIGAGAAALMRVSPDLIAGGPPCQEFSVAGGRREGDRADLTIAFAEMIRAVLPKWFVMENVPAAVRSVAYAGARHLLTQCGYGITEVVLNAAYFGVPQLRKRLFMIGRLDEEEDFLGDYLEEGRAENPLTVRDYLGDELKTDYYYRHPRTWERRAIYSIDEPAPTIRSTNRPIPSTYKTHTQDAAPKHKARPLTPHERARIQTFGKRFTLAGTNTDQDLMVANAVPVALARHIGEVILGYEEELGMRRIDEEFREWLIASQKLTPRSAGNVVSRLGRAQRLLRKPLRGKDPRTFIQELETNPDFHKLTVSVRSQLRRAIHLHCDFLVR